MILDTLAQSSRLRVERAKSSLPIEELKKQIYDGRTIKSFHNREDFAFEKALSKSRLSFICEIKRASPSKGMIARVFSYLQIAKEYEMAGADAISVLTEPYYFKGNNSYLTQISNEVTIPVLRKDFTVDEYQIYEAKYLGADAVLLICALLSTKELLHYIRLCDELGLSALVEAHSGEEIHSAIQAGARIIGVNNRDLHTFQVDISNSLELRNLVPENISFIAESGISLPTQVAQLRKARVDGVLIGESLMTSTDKKGMLHYLNGGAL